MPGNASAVQVRIQATSAAGAGGQRGHDLRLGAKPGYVAGERTPLNRVLVPPLTGAELRREMAPEWQRHPDNLARGHQRPAPGARPSEP